MSEAIKITVTAEELLEHFHEDPVQGVIAYTRDVALRNSRYIFVKTVSNRLHKGYCTHCSEGFLVDGPVKHNAYGTCPKCQSQCQYKHAGRGRKSLVDYAQVLYFEKSKIDSQVVTATWYCVSRNYAGHYTDVETKYTVVARYVYTKEQAYQFEKAWQGWSVKTNVYNPRDVYSSIPLYISNESIKDTLHQTHLEYCGWQDYGERYLLKYLGLATQYPSCEILTAHNFQAIVMAKMLGMRTYNAIDWQARKPHHILKLDKQDYLKLRDQNYSGCHPYDLVDLHLLQLAKKEKAKYTFSEIRGIRSFLDLEEGVGAFKVILKYTSFTKLVNYARKQYLLREKHYFRAAQTLITWRDYLDMCKRLGMEMTEQVLFPRDLMVAHDKMLERVKQLEDELLQKECDKRYKQIKKYEFEMEQLALVAPRLTKDIIKEGTELKHCVGSYAERHAKGKTCILFIRFTAKPKIPFYTVEVQGNKVVQVRGFKNQPPTKEVQEFIDAFVALKLTKKSNKKKEVQVV